MTTVAETPQEHRPAVHRPGSPSPLRSAAPGMVATGPAPDRGCRGRPGRGNRPRRVGSTLKRQLAERDAALRAVASADAIYAASGAAGSGWVVESGEQAMFMAEDLADLPPGRLYEFWLIDADGNAVAAGTLTDTDGVALVTLERNLEGATTFAVTVEIERVDQSVNDPVMVAAIEA